MFRKQKPLQDGAEAKAVVTSVALYQEGMRGNWGTGFTYDVGMRVHFDDDTTAEIVRRIGGIAGTDLKFTVGDIVPVRYDPGNREKIHLDEDSLRAEQQYARESARRRADAANEQAVRDAEAKLAGNQAERGAAGPTAELELLRSNRLKQLAELRDRGVLSNAEFELGKAKIVSEG